VRLDRELMEFDLAEHLVGREGIGALPRSEQAQLKTYLLEAHRVRSVGDAVGLLTEAASERATVEATSDPSLSLLHTSVETERGEEEVGFWVDSANPRFWLLHTKNNAKPAQAALRRLVHAAKTLDHGWLPRRQLRQIQSRFRPFGFRLSFDERPFYSGYDVVELSEPTHKLNVEHAGVGAEQIYGVLNQSGVTRRAMALSEVAFWERRGDEGTQVLRLSRDGRLRSSGTSLTSHLQAARSLVRSYEGFIVSIEERFRLRIVSDDEGLMIEGRPVALEAEKPEGFDFQKLVHRLVSGVEPFRLLGSVEWRDDDLAWVEAVDLHSGSPVALDITPAWMRLYLSEGLCGNTVARFVTNLQRAYNADLAYLDDETREVFEPGESLSPA